jgi:hypothetical protein
MTITSETVQLARAFGHAMQEQLSRAEFNQMTERNKMRDEFGVCASHDFCDANMVMLAAFETTFGRNPLPDAGEMSQADTDLWNDAWVIAKEAEFYA